MALITKPNGKCYYTKFYYKDVDGKLKQKCLSTGVSKHGSKKEAKEKAKLVEKEYLDNLRKDKQKDASSKSDMSGMTVKEYADYWLERMRGSVKDNTHKSYSDIAYGHITPLLGDIKLKDLDQFHLADFIERELEMCNDRQKIIDKRKKKDKDAKIQTYERPFYASIEKHIAVIKMMLEYAYEDGDVAENVAKKINKQILKKIPASKFVHVTYSKEEIDKLRKAIIGSTIEVPVIVTSHLGLRRSEVLGLKWSDIDFDNNCIYIRNTCVLVGTKIVYRDNETKNDSSNSVLPMLPELKEYLLKVKEQQKKEKKICGRGYIESAYVCRNPDGSLIKPEYVTKTFKRILENNELRHIRFHDIRHTVGTIILSETNDIKLVSEILRHSTIQTTADVYIQAQLDYKKNGLNKLCSNNEDK